MSMSVDAIAMDGRIDGTVMCRNRLHVPAPSSAAASSISSGTVASPAR